MRSKIASFVLALVTLVAASQYASGSVASPTTQADSRTFPETGHTVKGKFLKYWDEHGGLAQQGYPISEEMQEQSEVDGKTYTVQYFERAVFELHSENQSPNDVLLSLLGVFLYKQKYGDNTGAPSQTPSTAPDAVKFAETGKLVGGKFLAYWKGHGGLAQQGLPISDEFQERSDLDGKTYTVQYFERAVFELHPDNAGTPYEVLLSQLGTFRYKLQYETLQATVTPYPTTGSVENPTPIAPESLASVDLYTKYGEIKIDSSDMLDIKSANDEVLIRMFERIYEATGKSGTVNVEFKWLPNGSKLQELYSDDQKALGFNFVAGPALVEWYGEKEINNGVLQAQFPLVNGRGQGVNEFLNAAYNNATDADLGKNYVSVSLLKSFLTMYGGSNIPADQLNAMLGPELFAYIHASKDSNGKYVYLGGVPLQVTKK
ncbi:MAG: hypothetical protein QOH93_1043 [Chloroflexia bacterium]|nr:hypothetical protein [Chloroflexia bacterium]